MLVPLIAAFAAACLDARFRRIPFPLSLSAALAALWRLMGGGRASLAAGLSASLGSVLCLWTAARASGGGMGGGDYALVAALALFLRPAEALLFLGIAAALGTAHALLRARAFPFCAAQDPSIPFAPSLFGGMAAVALLRARGSL